MVREAIRIPEGGKEKIIGIGLGVPGYSDKTKGIALSYTYFEGWKNIPVRQIIEEEFQIPCYMGNNVDVMIYAYKWLVFHGSCDDMLFISVRTGARVMPVINNQAVSSRYGFPGELGQPIPTVRKRNALLSKIHNGYFKLLFEMMIAKNFTLW